MTYVTNEMEETFRKHYLVLMQEGFSTAYYMREAGTRNCCVLLTFSPEGVTITGDRTPQRNGTVSVCGEGYSVPWFAGKLSEGYLCEKFLAERWVLELAAAELRDPGSWIRDYTEDVEALNDLADHLVSNGDYDTDIRYLVDKCDSLGIPCDDLVPGYGYDPKEAGWLCAIQQAFSRLYREKETQQ